MKTEFAVWTLRGLTNQLFPIAITFFLSSSNNAAGIAYLAPVFIACSIANLLRSGAITTSTSQTPVRSSLKTEILYTLISTAPFLFITPIPSKDFLLFNCIIVLVSAVSGVFAARLECAKGLHHVGLCDLLSLMIGLLGALIFMDLSPRSLASALAFRECAYLLLIVIRTTAPLHTEGPKPSLTAYTKEHFGKTIFWISGPWKDYLITNVAVSLYSNTDYGTYYAVQLYWGLPSLFLGLILRPALRSFQNNIITMTSIRKSIIWMMLLSIIALALIHLLAPLTPPSPTFLVIAAILPAATAPFVVPAMMYAVKQNKNQDIVIQNLLWAVIGCSTLLLMRNEGLTGLATTMVMTNLASAYIVIKNKCSALSI